MCSYDSILSLPTSKATLLWFFDVASIYTGHNVTLEYLTLPDSIQILVIQFHQIWKWESLSHSYYTDCNQIWLLKSLQEGKFVDMKVRLQWTLQHKLGIPLNSKSCFFSFGFNFFPFLIFCGTSCISLCERTYYRIGMTNQYCSTWIAFFGVTS